MEYKVKSQKLQDIMDKQVRIVTAAQNLGAVTATTLTIPLDDFSADAIEATDVLIARNITDATVLTPSIDGTDLVLTDVALAATDIVEICIQLK